MWVGGETLAYSERAIKMIYATFWLLIHTWYSSVAIPMPSMDVCKVAMAQAKAVSGVVEWAVCINGNNP